MFEKLDRFIKDNSEEILITGGWGEDKISELEQKLNVSFREELKIFIRRYGLLMGYGVEIAVCGKNGGSRMVEATQNFRKAGLDERYLVIEGDGELAYCLDNESGKIVNWGLDNLEVYPVADNLESFILADLEEAKDTICIDHHITNVGFGNLRFIDPEASSTCEILFRLFDYDKISFDCAQDLYLGIVHDTGVLFCDSYFPAVRSVLLSSPSNN